MAKNVLSSVIELAETVCAEFGCYLYDAEYQKEGKNQILRVYVDKDGGITIDECETVSRKLSEELDRLNLIATAYHLEVSSPGVERKLTKQWHYEKVIGKQIEVSLYAPIESKKVFVGILTKIVDGVIWLDCDGTVIEFSPDKIASAKLYFDISAVLKGQ